MSLVSPISAPAESVVASVLAELYANSRGDKLGLTRDSFAMILREVVA